MAVYTDVDQETFQGFLAEWYDLGKLVEFSGISEGIQNTNYFVKTEKGKFILTLFERRTPEKDLPYFFDFINHLTKEKFPCPVPIKTNQRTPLTTLAGKSAALLTFLPGRSTQNPTPSQCFAVGRMIAELHSAGSGFKRSRENLFSPKAVETMFKKMRPGIARTWPGWEKEIEAELVLQAAYPFKGLPFGTIHADIFPENVFFEGDEVTGLIDFYFTCSDILIFDLAIALSCWGFSGDGRFKNEHFQKMLEGYETTRSLEKTERNALPILLRRSALSFLMTRIEYVLYPPPNILGVQKDPKEFMNILAKLQLKRHIEDYL